MDIRTASETKGAPVDVTAVPGPWFIEYEPGWPVTVSRWNPAATPGYDYESMVDERGKLCEFMTRREAREAIAQAGGAQ